MKAKPIVAGHGVSMLGGGGGGVNGKGAARLARHDEDATEPGETSSLLTGYVDSNEPTRSSTAPAAEMPFDDALRLAKFGRFNVFLIIISGIIMATSIIETLSISFVLPASECEMRFSSTQKGVLSGVGFAGIIASSYVWGFLSDTAGRRAVMVPSLLLAFGCTLLSSFSPNFWTLVCFRFLHGLFIAGSSASVYAYLGEFHTNAERSRAIMFASVVFGTACMLMPIIAWLIINETWELALPWLGIVYRPWRFFMVGIGLPSLFCGLVLLPLPESPKFVLSMGRQAETVAVLRWMYRANGGPRDRMAHVGRICEEAESIALRERRERYAGAGLGPVLRSMWSQTTPLFGGVYLRMTLIASAMQFGNYVNTNGMYMWFPDTVNRVIEFTQHNPNATATTMCDVLRWSSARAQLQAMATAWNVSAAAEAGAVQCGGGGNLETETFSYTFGLEVLYAVGFALIALIITRIGKCTILVTLHVSFAACGYAIMYLVLPMISLYLYLVILLIGLAIPVINAATIDLYPTSMRGMAVCLTVMMGRLGGMVGVNMIALLIENHCELTFGIAATIMLACGIISFFIPGIMGDRKKKAAAAAVEEGSRPAVPALMSVATVESAMKTTNGKTGSFGQLTQ